MRRQLSLLLLLSLVVTGAAPLAGERLVCPMTMTMAMPATSSGEPPAAATCRACAMESQNASAPASVKAASCCGTAPVAEAETVPATFSAQRRGGITAHSDGIAIALSPVACPEIPALVAPSFDAPPPNPAASPPPSATLTTHLRN